MAGGMGMIRERVEARRAVRAEMPAVDASTIVGFSKAMLPVVDHYVSRLRGKGKVDDAFLADVVERAKAVAAASPNVIHVETYVRPTVSVVRKGRAEVHVVVVEPSVAGSYCISRIHLAATKARLDFSYDDGRIEFSSHAAERLVERGGTGAHAIRALAKSIYDGCGLLAIGARLWASTKADAGGQHGVMLPVKGGVVMGTVMLATADDARAACVRISRSGVSETKAPTPGLGVAPRFVCVAPEDQLSILFTGMTYIGDAELAPAKARVRDLLVEYTARHPCLGVAGLAYAWPTVRRVADAYTEVRTDLARAYEELAALHRDPDMRRVFGEPAWDRVPPLPWEETVADVTSYVGIPVPRFAPRAGSAGRWTPGDETPGSGWSL